MSYNLALVWFTFFLFSLMLVITFYLCIIFIYWLICLAFCFISHNFSYRLGECEFFFFYNTICFLIPIIFVCFVLLYRDIEKGPLQTVIIRKELESNIPYICRLLSKFWIDFSSPSVGVRVNFFLFFDFGFPAREISSINFFNDIFSILYF